MKQVIELFQLKRRKSIGMSRKTALALGVKCLKTKATGRFDEKIYVPLPDKKARRKIIDLRLKDVPKEESIDCSYLSEITDGFNGADVDYLCEKAKEFASRRVIQGKDSNEILTKADFDNAVASVKSSVLDTDKKEMELWIKNNLF